MWSRIRAWTFAFFNTITRNLDLVVIGDAASYSCSHQIHPNFLFDQSDLKLISVVIRWLIDCETRIWVVATHHEVCTVRRVSNLEPVPVSAEFFRKILIGTFYRELDQDAVPEWKAKYLNYKVGFSAYYYV
jgi:hypothetical protein